MNRQRQTRTLINLLHIAVVGAMLAMTTAFVTAAPSTAGAVPAPATTGAAKASTPRLVAFRGHSGHVWRNSGDLKKLKPTSKPFKRFITRELTRMWKLNGARPECAHSQVIEVSRWRSDGYALGWELWRAHDGDPASCTVSEGDDSLFKKGSNGWRKVAGSASYVFECSKIDTFHVPANIAGPVCDTNNTDHVYGPKTNIRLKLGKCPHCTVRLTQANIGFNIYWHSKTQAVRSGSANTFKVPASRTVGMSFEVFAPWATGVNWIPNVVTRYRDRPLGHPVTVRQAAHAKRATGCWAGASARRVTIPVTVSSFKTTDLAGNPAKGLRVFARNGLNEGAAVWTGTLKGSLGNQDAYYC